MLAAFLNYTVSFSLSLTQLFLFFSSSSSSSFLPWGCGGQGGGERCIEDFYIFICFCCVNGVSEYNDKDVANMGMGMSMRGE